MEILTAIVIEDEKNNAEALIELIREYCEGIEVKGRAENVKDGQKLIKSHKPDIVFLDVELPGGSGFLLFNYYDTEPPFVTIFTTAYDQYAIKAFEVNALDYLTKPIAPKRLKQAILRARGLIEAKIQEASLVVEPKVRISTGKEVIYVDPRTEIVRCEGDDNCTTIIFENKRKVLVTKTLKTFEQDWGKYGFDRCHKQHLINSAKIARFVNTERILELTNHEKIPVSVRLAHKFN